MYGKLKVLHLIGLAMFFGTILSHTIISIYSKTLTNITFLSSIREIMQMETNFLLAPGLIILTISGIGMIIFGKLNVKKLKWLKIHGIIAIFVLLNSFIILIPVGGELLQISTNLTEPSAQIDLFTPLKKKESIFGALNVIMVIVLIVIATLKPKLKK